MKINSMSDARVIGGIGSLLILLFAVPSIGWLLGVAGFIMTLLAVQGISQLVNDKRIFRGIRNAIGLAGGALVAGLVTVGAVIYQLLGVGAFVGSRFVPANNVGSAAWFGLIATGIAGLAVVEAFLILSALSVRRSYRAVATRVNVEMFEKAGLVYLIGAATFIVGIGIPLVVIAQIMLAVAFFSIRDMQGAPTATQAPAVTVTG